MVHVKKMDGGLEEFSAFKLKRSLFKAGADKKTANKIIKKVRKTLYEGIPTRKLYQYVLKEFKKLQPDISSRYTLKNAILRLGIDGFPFEKFVLEIFQKKGWVVELNRIVHGKYIPHEIDVSAKNKKRLMIECKHHRKPWLGCSIKTALYVYARFLDVQKDFDDVLLATNTGFSNQVIKYAKGVGLKLMGWSFPKDDSIEVNITKFRLYPVTMLTSVDKHILDVCLREKILLISDLQAMGVKDLQDKFRITEQKANKVLEEANTLLKSK